MKVKSLSHAQLFGTPWTVAYQAPPSMEFSRQEYRSGLPFPSPGDLPDPGIEPRPPTLQEDALLSELPGSPRIHKTTLSIVSMLSPPSTTTVRVLFDCNGKGKEKRGVFVNPRLTSS